MVMKTLYITVHTVMNFLLVLDATQGKMPLSFVKVSHLKAFLH